MKLFQEDFGKIVVKLSVKKLKVQYNGENRSAAAKKNW